ncbi:MAG: TIR domain-containing protein [Firmicutes bacterium]|nr:TIR domain-containing protein [Bacillota bacterium]
MKAFLSHSSKDKEHYVEKVAKKIGKDRVVYDEFSFEKGLKSIEEIDRGLDASDLFVVFISENSINSKWVQEELFRANTLLKEDAKLKRIYPIIIDSRIKYNDNRIPEWLRENNLKLVISSNKAASLIMQRLRELSYMQHPKHKERDNIFVGRNKIIEEFEMRINDFERNVPFAIIASGLQQIGRKKVMYHSLVKTDSIMSSYRLPIIELNSHESIEDFILKIDDLGMTEKVERSGLLKCTIDEKIKMLEEQLNQLREENERIFINDKGCIINPNRQMVDWFNNLNDRLKNTDYIVLAIAAKFRIHESFTYSYDNIMFTHIPELNQNERKRLFYRYLEYEDLNIPKEDIRDFTSILSGYPMQAYYAVWLIKDLGLTRAKYSTNLIVEFNTERVVDLINKYESNGKIMGILALLTHYGTIGINTYFNIVGTYEENNDILEDLLARGICETLGVNKEYIRLNDVIHDYLIRMGLSIPKEYKQKLLNDLNEFIENYSEDDYLGDISKYQYSIKKAIIDNRIEEIEKLLIPSHYLQSMKELYDVYKKYDDVINLADRILQSDNCLDKYIENEIRYYLCMSLARNKDERFKKEVKEINGAEHDFLFGFYYRQTGRPNKAIQRYEKALSKRKRFARAQRDLVQVYINTEEYDKAFTLSKENYERDNKKNPYHVHAYFNCLIKQPHSSERNEILKGLIEVLRKNKHKNAREFYLRCKAQYEAFVNNDEKEALEIINKACKESQSLFGTVDKYYICAKFNNTKEMKRIISSFGNKYSMKISNNYNTLIKFKIILCHIENRNDEIPKMIEQLKFYPESAKNKLMLKYAGAYSEIAATCKKE